MKLLGWRRYRRGHHLQEEDLRRVSLQRPARVHDRQLGKVVIGVENITGKVVWIVNLFSEEQYHHIQQEDLQCVIECRQTVQRHYFKNLHETIYEGFIDALLISNHVVNKVIIQTLIETKNLPATTEVYVKPGEYHVKPLQ